MHNTHILLFLVTLPIPLLMIIGGWWMLKKPPRKINLWVGYRFARARKSQEAWDFAQRIGGRSLFAAGVPLFIASALLSWLLPPAENMWQYWHVLIMCVQLAVLLASLCFDGAQLRRKFDEDGKPR